MASVGGRSRGRRIRGWPVTAGTALMVAAAAMAAAPGAKAATASNPASSPAAGTASAKVTQAQRATVQHATMSSSAAATGDLSTVLSETVHGGYIAAGIGMRNLGYGTIDITGIPAGATVKSATLLWDILDNSADASFAQGTLNGHAFTGTQWASGASPCWPVTANFSYEADVTSLVTGNGSYKLAGFATGQSDGADPWTSGSSPPLDEGASLVVVYQLSSMPEVTVQIGEGATETDSGNTATATLNGFTANAKPSATTTYIVADGQLPGNTASFNGTTLPGVSFPGDDPQAVPHYSQGNLWDTVTTDVSSHVSPGDTSATVGVTGNEDCLVWVGQVLSVSTGSVLAFGDSVAAGYGLGYSLGHPDNPDAYSAVLAQKLGYGDENYAVEGRCAGADAGCSDTSSSVAAQIQQVPAGDTPDLITLTVGANDINFAGCLTAILQDGDLSMRSSSDPCNPSKLSTDLASFRTSLKSDLTTLKDKYPGVPIMVMDYYNPFPAAPTGLHLACTFSDEVTLSYLHAQEGWEGAVFTALYEPGVFVLEARSVQGRIHQDAATVLGQLNSAINTTASGLATVVNTNDFAGHDICSNGPWVFAPTLNVDMSLKIASLTRSAHLSFGGEVCPDPVAEPPIFSVSVRFSNSFLHISGSLALTEQVNCLPHPTATGQTAIASDFLNQGA
jgi:lysophospholipase L1-like esterase